MREHLYHMYNVSKNSLRAEKKSISAVRERVKIYKEITILC